MKPRVLHVINTSRTVPLFVQPIAEALQAQGFENAIASPAGPELSSLHGTGIGHYPLPVSRRLLSLRHLRTALSLARIVRRGDFDILHLHGIVISTLGRAVAALLRRRAVYHCRGTYYEEGGELLSERIIRRVWPGIEKILASATGRAFTLNPEDARDLVQRAGIPEERVTCLGVGGCGIDLTAWDPARLPPNTRMATRRGLGIPEDAFVIGFVGRLVREKGILELLEAFARLRAEGRDVALLLIGGTWASERDQGTAAELHRRADELGVTDRLAVLDFDPEPMERVAAMDVLALPSYREGFGQVLVEAGALGLPVVASRTRGARHAVIDGRTGLLVPVRDVDALADALRTIIDDPALAERLGAAGAERARGELGRNRVLETVVAEYERLARELPR